MQTETYVFVIIDEGLCKKLIVDPDLDRLTGLARSAIEEYLAEHGFGDEDTEELATDDGYAKIVHATPGVTDSDEHIWSYSFDGEASLNYAFSTLGS